MTAGSVEATLELWASSLRSVKERIRPLFRQDRTAAAAGLFLDALLGPERRKTGWMRAEAAGDPGPWRQQALLDRSRWEADARRDLVRDDALETLAEPDAVLVIDETGFLKQGQASCGVARQYTGSAGKITNCQIGVFAAYVSRHGHAFIDRALYLPKAWTGDPARMAGAHVPPGTPFATKPRLALEMIERALAAGVPFRWVAADTVYGCGEVEIRLRRAGKGYVLGAHARMGSPPGATSRPLPAPPRRSPQGSRRAPGNASPRGTVRKASGCTTGRIASWPTSMPASTPKGRPVCGRAGF
jgi:SRSO17 transposase